MSFAQRERRALVEAMRQLGPDAPTLCSPWTTRDLAAHLLVRERRLDATLGIVLPFLAGHTESVQDAAARAPWSSMLERLESGPPWWSPFYLVDAMVNLGEMFVHHEDVLRARDDWTARRFSGADERSLWSLLGTVGRASFRSSPVGVVATTPDGRRRVLRGGRATSVTLRGDVADLVLYAFGRNEVHLDFEGSDADIAALGAIARGV